ncbi:MAG: nitroreductase family protein [Candidatus Altiarchaeota archaeon]
MQFGKSKIQKRGKFKTYELILSRRSIRKFQQRKISKKILLDCVNAARLAPSSKNMQPLEYIIITKNIEEIFSCIKWAYYLEDGAPRDGEKPKAYIAILLNRSINEPKHDVGLAAENIVLTALERNVASCILANIDREKLRKILNVPENYSIELLIALGYGKQTAVVDKFEGDHKYWIDKEGILHVPKRSLKEIVHKEKF